MSEFKKGFIVAIEENDEVGIKNILANGADLNANIPGEMFAPIHYSSGLHESITRLLLEHGADPNIKTIDGLTPLHIAASWGKLNIIKLLLKNGANATIRDDDGNTPMDLAKDFKHSDCMSILGHCFSKLEHTFSIKDNYIPKNKSTNIHNARGTNSFNLSHSKTSYLCNLKTTFSMTPEKISSRIKITLKNNDFVKSYTENPEINSAVGKNFNLRKNKHRNTPTERSFSKRTTHDRISQGISSSVLNTNLNDKQTEDIQSQENYYSCDEISKIKMSESLTPVDNKVENDNIPKISAASCNSAQLSQRVLKIDSDHIDHVSQKQHNSSCAESKTVNYDEIPCDISSVEDLETFTVDGKQDTIISQDLLPSHSRKKWLKRAKKYVHVKAMINCIRKDKSSRK